MLAFAAQRTELQGLAICLATGYTLSAIFSCDPGSPLNGSWQQQLHIWAALFSMQVVPTSFFRLQNTIFFFGGIGSVHRLLSGPLYSQPAAEMPFPAYSRIFYLAAWLCWLKSRHCM